MSDMRISNTMDIDSSFGNFCCDRPTLEPPTQRHVENKCLNTCFFIYRKSDRVYYKCTKCGRMYKASIKNGVLSYVAEKVILKKKRKKRKDLGVSKEFVEKNILKGKEKKVKKKIKKKGKKK